MHYSKLRPIEAFAFVVVLVFNVPPTAKVIWRRGHGFKSHPTDWRSRESNLRPLVYKASGLSTTPQRLLPLHLKRSFKCLNHNQCLMSVKCNVKAKKFYLKIALISNVGSA